MITETIRPSEVKKWDWIKINDHEASTVSYVAGKWRTIVVCLTNGVVYELDKLQTVIDRIVSF